MGLKIRDFLQPNYRDLYISLSVNAHDVLGLIWKQRNQCVIYQYDYRICFPFIVFVRGDAGGVQSWYMCEIHVIHSEIYDDFILLTFREDLASADQEFLFNNLSIVDYTENTEITTNHELGFDGKIITQPDKQGHFVVYIEKARFSRTRVLGCGIFDVNCNFMGLAFGIIDLQMIINGTRTLLSCLHCKIPNF